MERHATAGTTPLVFSGHIASDAAAVSAFLTGLRRELTRRAHPAAAEPDWELVLAELLNNVVEHAYGPTPSGDIGYWLLFSTEGLNGRLTDSGVPMPGLALPLGAAADLEAPLAELPEGGFGWNLIRRLTERLAYRREDGFNSLDFSIQCIERETAP